MDLKLDLAGSTIFLPKTLLVDSDARDTLRRWLDDLEERLPLSQPTSSKDTIYAPPTPPRAADPPSAALPPPRRAPVYNGIFSFHDSDPKDHKWVLLDVVRNPPHAVFEREMPSGLAQLRYFYTTGTAQLAHPNPAYLGRGGPDDPRRVQETFRDLSEAEFEKLLRNPPTYYGKGYVRRPSPPQSYDSDDYSEESDNYDSDYY